MLSPLDEAVGYDGRSLASAKNGVNGGVFRLDTSVASLQKLAPSHSTSGGCQDCRDCQGPPDPVIPVHVTQTQPAAPAYYQYPLSPDSPSWAQQPTPPWPTADANANGSLLRSPTTCGGVDVPVPVSVPVVPGPSSLSSSGMVNLPNSTTMFYYTSPPEHLDLSTAQCVPIHHPSLHPQSPNSPSASRIHNTGLVSPPCSLIGQPSFTLPLGPDNRRRESEAQAPPTSPSLLRKPPQPGTVRPRKQVRFKENSPPNEAENEKERNRAYHREVGARNRLKEKQEKARFESEKQLLETLNIKLIAEEKLLAAEKQSLVDELYRHSLCKHCDVTSYLDRESIKIMQNAKNKFLKPLTGT